jgi:serine/threonine protein phosphatase PrpC
MNLDHREMCRVCSEPRAQAPATQRGRPGRVSLRLSTAIMKRSSTALGSTVWPDVVDAARNMYNISIDGKQGTLDARGVDRAAERVGTKIGNFVACFSPQASVFDLLSKKTILADRNQIKARYQTAFRESGTALKMAVTARVVLLPTAAAAASAASADVLVLDLEQHSSLVTPLPSNLDGALGLRGPRDQALWAMYAVSGGVITKLWLSPAAPSADADGKPLSGEAALQALKASPKGEWAAFMALARDSLGCECTECVGALHSTSVGRFEMQGRRPTMEDQLSVQNLAHPLLGRPGSGFVQFLGLFDGHGGMACASFAAERLHVELAAAKAFGGGDVGQGLTEAFMACEEAFLRESESPSGSCALVCVVGGGKLYLGHCGDSRAVLGTATSASPHTSPVAVELTEDHKPDGADEKARILGIGGSVVIGGRCARVTHAGTSMMLATSRSFGDRHFKDSWEGVATANAMERALAKQDAAAAGAEGGSGEAVGRLRTSSGMTLPAVDPKLAEAAAAAAQTVSQAAAEAARRAVDDQRQRAGASAAGQEEPEDELKMSMPDAAVAAAASAAEEAARQCLRASIPPLLSPVPTVSQRVLSPSDRFVILACDGVWDVLSNQQAVDAVHDALSQPGATADQAARRLAVDAYTEGSEDNISVLVAVLRHELS